MVSAEHSLSQRRQCALLRLSRSSLYYQPVGESAENLIFMKIIDEQFLETPWYGSRQMARHMQRQGHKCGRHRVRRLMRKMRLTPIYQTPNTSKKHPQHKVWPYLLKDLAITRPNQVPLSHMQACVAGQWITSLFIASTGIVKLSDSMLAKAGTPHFRPLSVPA